MTDDNLAHGAPLSDDTLADLHAGALDDETATHLWERVNQDPRAREVLAALDATTADLGTLGSAPGPPLPNGLADRIDSALAEEAGNTASTHSDPARVVDINTARRNRNRNRLLAWGAGVATTAAAAVVAIAIVQPGDTGGGAAHVAAPHSSSSAETPAAVALRSGKLGKAVGSVAGSHDYGSLRDQTRLDECLAANDIDPDKKPAGVQPGTVDGKNAIIVLYPAGQYAQFRLIALTPDCDSDGSGLLADTTVGHGTDEGGG